MGSAHTPGPWTYLPSTGQVVAGDGGRKAVVYETWLNEADGFLIASAPDLLAALKECREAVAAAMRVIADIDAGKLIGMEPDTKYQRLIDECAMAGVSNGFGVRADTAIAKAEGRDA